MSAIVKQTVDRVVFMCRTSTWDDVRCFILEIDNEGAGRSFRLSTEKANSAMYFDSPEDFRVIYETAVALWAQGDIYVPGDADTGVDVTSPPTLSNMVAKRSE
jgi:hypothetical protein